MALSETRHTSEANQRAPPEHVMSAGVTSATCMRTIPHGNLTDICHSVQVRSDPKAKYNSQRYHDLLNTAFATHVHGYEMTIPYICLEARCVMMAGYKFEREES